MSDPEFPGNSRMPTLVQLCQRVASNCTDSITTLGDELSYPLVKPILERCTAEQLSVIEESSPHLLDEALEIWMQLCIRKYPTAVEKYLDDDSLEPRSWRERYMVLKHEEERRFERLGSKLKAQRMEAEERKKEREVKLTDRVPPPKRPRTGGWGAPVQPRTLIQKTLSEASKISKAMYHSRMIPPMNGGKTYRVLPKPSCSIMPTTTSTIPSRVAVNTVQKRLISNVSNGRAPPHASSISPSTPRSASTKNQALQRPSPGSALAPPTTSMVPRQSGSSPVKGLLAASPSGSSPDARPMKPVVSLKKDPMASLFVPKHRAYSQRPV
ncbi:Transcription elongation factor B polypeptide 3 [Leucoagaricus sp. SymC.cos]|nr:Transcription elongation factor B polypeptide 3 [Leucoagaricus sp. SymC.cos]